MNLKYNLDAMKILLAITLCVGFAYLSLPISAQTKKSTLPCEDSAQTQFDMNNCAHMIFVKSDEALNVTYKKVLAATSEDGPQYVQKLKAAQLLWIKYRDATCESESALNEGGTMHPMVYDYCLASVTDERNERLKELLKVLKQ